jgi:diguanylate cyclase (GGDEF)-like protein/PAS domain S-box-containing protein
VVSIGFFTLYRLSFREHKQKLQSILQSQINLIDAIIAYEEDKNLTTEEQEKNILNILKQAKKSCLQVGKTVELTLAKKENKEIIFLLTNCLDKRENPEISLKTPLNNKISVPSSKALNGESGTIIDLDYRGVKVLAAYQPLGYFDWGIVVKMDLAEVRSPFIKIGIYTAIIGIIINILASILFSKLTEPMLEEIEKRSQENLEINQQLQQEIIEKNNIENALQNELEILAKIMEMNQVGIILINPEGKIILANHKIEEILGLSRQKLDKFLAPQFNWNNTNNIANNSESNYLLFEEILRTKKAIFNITKSLELDNKSKVFLSINAAPIFNEQEQIKGILYTFADVTQQTISQQELAQREAQFRAIFETSVLGIAILDLAGKIIKTNHALQEILAYSEAELLNLDLKQITCHYQTNKSTIQSIIDGELEFYQSEQRLLCKNGEIIWANLTISLVKDTNNKSVFIVTIIENITERKQSEIELQKSEQKYRNMIETAHEGVWIIDNENKTNFINQRTSDMLGYSEAEILGKQLIDFTDQEGSKIALAKIEARHQSIKEQHEFKFIHKDGQEVWTLIATNPIFDSEGNYNGSLRLISDITEHKKVEKALQQTNEKLKNYVRELEAHNRERDLLNRLNEFIQACLSVTEAFGVLGDLLEPLFPECSGAVFIINSSNTLVESVSNWGEESFTETVFPPHDCWSLRHGYIHLSNQAYHSLFCQHTKHDHQPNISLCLPMMAQNKSIGLLYLASNNNYALNEHKQQFARTVAENISLNIANLQLRESLHQNSIRDALTGLFNRRYLEESLERELYLAQRKNYSVGVIMLDIDHFKRFNDTFGHEAGDYVLKEVAKLLQNEVRKGDIPCRYGGEELTVIMPEADLDLAFNRAEKIRLEISQLILKHHEKLLGQITASLGVACYPENGKTLEKVMQIADNYLYQAKKQGRNCVIKQMG